MLILLKTQAAYFKYPYQLSDKLKYTRKTIASWIKLYNEDGINRLLKGNYVRIKGEKRTIAAAGYDVIERQSGTSIKGKSRISKKGNRHIRRALHFPALIAKRYNKNLQKIFNRIQERTPHKMIGYVALQRKLLTLMYVLWKNDTEYIEDYQKNRNQEMKKQEALLSA